MTRALLITLFLLAGCDRAPAQQRETPAPEPPPFGGLDVEVIGDGRGPVVVLLHGFGTPPDDLVPVARLLASDPRLAAHRFVVPAGRLALGPGARMWWPIPPRALREAQAERGERDVAADHPAELPASRRAVLMLLDDVSDRFEVPPEQIAVGGFSQGAMLAVDVSLRREGRRGPIVVLSGSLVAERDLSPHLSRARGVPVFISHGRTDSVLPFSGAEHLRDVLAGAGADVRFRPFDGDHELLPSNVEGVADFLTDALPSEP